MAKRTIMAAGNWKMNKTPSEAKAFVEDSEGSGLPMLDQRL